MRLSIPLLLLAGACSSSETPPPPSTPPAGASGGTAVTGSTGDSGAAPVELVVVTFNTGTTPGLDHDGDGDAYTQVEADWSDEHYGDGLAWLPAIEAAAAWFATADADLVAFQEIFDVAECAAVPSGGPAGFVCDDLGAGGTVPHRLLGDAYTVQCHPGRSDKCLAVHERLGAWKGPLAGEPVPDCGSGARVARGGVVRPDGSELTVVHVHGSSGVSGDDAACRVAQIDQVFVDLDGTPGVDGREHVVLGDLNTDPGRMGAFDPSAVRWNEEVGPGLPLGWVTEVGEAVPPTYAGLFNIDHVASDAFTGSCTHDTVLDTVYFDHLPARCALIRADARE